MKMFFTRLLQVLLVRVKYAPQINDGNVHLGTELVLKIK